MSLSLLLAACTAAPRDVLFFRDASSDVGPTASRCATSGVAFCESFEAPPLAYPPWGQVGFYASAVVDEQQTFRGSHALHIHTSTAPADAVVQGEVTETVAVPLPDFFARLFVYLKGPLPEVELRLAALLQADPPQEGQALWLGRGGALAIDLSTAPVTATTPLPVDRWACVEWQVTVASAGETRVWLDETPIGALQVARNTELSPTLGRVSLGLAIFGTHPPLDPIDAWFDEVALDGQRIGCSR